MLQDGQTVTLGAGFVDYYIDLGLLVCRCPDMPELFHTLNAEPDRLNGGLHFWNPDTAPVCRYSLRSHGYAGGMDFFAEEDHPGGRGWAKYDEMQRRYRETIGAGRCECGKTLTGKYLTLGRCLDCGTESRKNDVWAKVLTEVRLSIEANSQSAEPKPAENKHIADYLGRLRGDAELRIWLRGDGAIAYDSRFQDEFDCAGGDADLLHSCIEASIYVIDGEENIDWPEVWNQYDSAMDIAQTMQETL